MSRRRLLDLCCGAGGASEGYRRAGFDVVGVDTKPRGYRYDFIQGDALWFLGKYGASDFDAVHASPPCPRYSAVTPAENRDAHLDLVAPIRHALRELGIPYVIENVPGAPLENPVLLCGASFGLGTICRDGRWRNLRRHRLFESNVWLMSPGCACRGETVGVYGDGGGGQSTRPSGGGGYKAYPEEARAAMGIDWMRRGAISDAIPPAYTEFIGEQLLAAIEGAAA